MSQDSYYIDCHCGATFEPYDEEEEDCRYYRRTSGNPVCQHCQPSHWEAHDVLCQYFEHIGRDMTVEVVSAIEAAGYEVATYRNVIIQIKNGDEVLFTYPGIDPESDADDSDSFGDHEADDLYDLLPVDIKLICQQVLFDDLIDLAENYKVSENSIADARFELNRLKAIIEERRRM